MAILNSQIIICKGIKNDRDYINVLDYTPTQMLAVCNSSAHFVASRGTYSFIRDDGSISTDFTYAQALQCNFVAFQNPDYNNRWFFAWVDKIEYKGEKNIRIHFTIDYWSTWFSELTKLPVFVEREHVLDDSFGLHTLPEPVKPDSMINMNVVNKFYSNFSIVVFYSPAQITSADLGYALNGIYYTPTLVNRYDCSNAGISSLMGDLSNGGSLANANILSVNVIPNAFIPPAAQSIKNIPQISTVNDPVVYPMPTNLNGYIPVNHKTLMYPYNMLAVNNGNIEKIYRFEKFMNVGITGAVVNISGGLLPNGGAAAYPTNYDGRTGANVAESLTLGDLPMIASSSDSFAAWLAQKSSGTVVQGILSTLTGALAGGMKGGWVGAAVGAGAGLVGGITNYVAQEESARAERDSVIGTNNADLDMVNSLLGYSFSQKCCIADDAERIDRFFSQFGYNVSTVKVPNYNGRSHWNYVKINGNAGYGNMPEDARSVLNNILNKGVTIWHNEANLGNYFIGGTKMENPIV